MHRIAMACASAPWFSCYQHGNSRPVFCHAQPPCCSVGERKRSCLSFYLLRATRNPKPLANIGHICFFGPGICFNLIYLGATQTICNAQRCQKETSGWFDDLKRSLWNPGNMLKLESWITRYPTKTLRLQLWQSFDGLGPSSQDFYKRACCKQCLATLHLFASFEHVHKSNLCPINRLCHSEPPLNGMHATYGIAWGHETA